MGMLGDHELVQELARHEREVTALQKRSQRWRLTDCSEPTLVSLRHRLIEEMIALEGRMKEADNLFSAVLNAGDPLATEQTLQQINRFSAEWRALNSHLQEIDQAILERHLQSRLIEWLGSKRNLYIADALIFTLIMLSIVLVLIEIAFPAMSEATLNTFIWIDTLICGVLLTDFGLRLWLVEDRRWYIRNYWIDFVASIPFYGLLRFGRLVRVVRFTRLLRFLRLGRAMRALTFAFSGMDKLVKTFEIVLLKRALYTTLALLLLSAFAISFLESNPVTGFVDADVREFEEGLWWSFTTVITGGFADLYNPQTNMGRLLTVLLVLIGFAITSIFTAALTSVLVGDDSSRIEQNQHRIEDDLTGIASQLDLMSRETNEGLIALERVTQAISNHDSAEAIAETLTTTMLEEFDALQASVHLFSPQDERLYRLHAAGLDVVTPASEIVLDDPFLGRVSADLLQEDLRTYDIEPISRPAPAVKGIAMACPLVAQNQLLGIFHVVLPGHLGRFYLYNRAPQTLAHHAALAFYVAMSQGDRFAYSD